MPTKPAGTSASAQAAAAVASTPAAMQKQTYLYEVLLRFSPDGLRGAHMIRAERVSEGSRVLAEIEGNAEPLDPAQIGSVLGQAMPAVVAQVQALTARVEALTAERDDLQAKLASQA